jgi:methionine-S-sulfoxide reductase
MNNQERIYLGGGCFWCIEAIFQRVTGVLSVRSGYSGGTKENPTYEEVSSGETGHAEVVELIFNPTLISLEEILELFFELHDPTTLNRQGADFGTQYRSTILVTTPEQFRISLQTIADLNLSGRFQSPIVTQVVKFEKFYLAEDYHQNFYNKNQDYGYCKVVIDPKLKKLIDIKKNKDII